MNHQNFRISKQNPDNWIASHRAFQYFRNNTHPSNSCDFDFTVTEVYSTWKKYYNPQTLKLKPAQ